MTNEKMKRQLAAALEKTAPDDVIGVLSRCETRKGTVINMPIMKTAKRKWTILVAACLAVVLLCRRRCTLSAGECSCLGGVVGCQSEY